MATKKTEKVEFANVSELKKDIATRKEVLEIVGQLLQKLADDEHDITTDYKEIGKSDKQRTSWRTGELLWEDEEQTIPSYEGIYDYVPKADEDYSEDDIAKLGAIKYIADALVKLI